MATSSEVAIVTTLAGDVNADLRNTTALNEDSPGMTEIQDLDAGANVIIVPSGAVIKGVILQPPSDNEETLILKGISGDTGIGISPTNPTFICFADEPTSFVITAGDAVSSFRLTWI